MIINGIDFDERLIMASIRIHMKIDAHASRLKALEIYCTTGHLIWTDHTKSKVEFVSGCDPVNKKSIFVFDIEKLNQRIKELDKMPFFDNYQQL